jgi:hypothetical protein
MALSADDQLRLSEGVFELCGLTTHLPFVPDGQRARGSRETPQCN